MQLINQMNDSVMEAFAKIVKCILYGTFVIRPRDYREFRHHVDALRQIATVQMSLRRKKRTLGRIHDLIPRLLRERYIQRTITVERMENIYGTEL